MRGLICEVLGVVLDSDIIVAQVRTALKGGYFG